MEIKACALGTWESKKQWEASSGQRDSRGTEHRDQDGHGWGRAARDLGSVPSFSVSSLCLVPVEDCRMWSTALLHQHMALSLCSTEHLWGCAAFNCKRKCVHVFEVVSFLFQPHFWKFWSDQLGAAAWLWQWEGGSGSARLLLSCQGTGAPWARVCPRRAGLSLAQTSPAAISSELGLCWEGKMPFACEREQWI